MPYVKTTRRIKAKFQKDTIQLFPGYIFVAFNLLDRKWTSINYTIGVNKLIMARGIPQQVDNNSKLAHRKLRPKGFWLINEELSQGTKVGSQQDLLHKKLVPLKGLAPRIESLYFLKHWEERPLRLYQKIICRALDSLFLRFLASKHFFLKDDFALYRFIYVYDSRYNDVKIEILFACKRLFPNSLDSFGFESNISIAFASAFAFFAGTTIPVLLFITASRQPGTSVVITGKPKDAASIIILGSFSPRWQANN